MPSINLRQKLYIRAIQKNLDPAVLANEAVDLVLWLADETGLVNPKKMDKEETRQFVLAVKEDIKKMFKLLEGER